MRQPIASSKEYLPALDSIPSMTNCLTSLPIELLDIILSYLSLTQLFHLSCTSTDLYKRVKHSDKIWKAAYFSRWRTYIICGETESKGMGSVDSMKRKMARSSLSLKWKSAYLSRAGSERAIGRGQTRIGHQAYGISEMQSGNLHVKVLDDGRVLKASGRGRETIMASMGRVLCMAGCFPEFVALALDYQVIQLLDLQSLQPFNTLHSPSMSQTSLLRVTSNRVISGDASGSLLSWKLRQRGKKARFEGIYLGHASAVLACQFDDQLIVSSSKEDVRIWEIKAGVCLGVLPFQECQTVQLSNSFVGAGNVYGELIVCSRSGRQYYKMESQESGIQALAFDETTGTLTSLTASGHLLVQEIQGHGKLWEESLPRHGHERAYQIELFARPPRIQVHLRAGSAIAFGLIDGQPTDPCKPSIWIKENRL